MPSPSPARQLVSACGAAPVRLPVAGRPSVACASVRSSARASASTPAPGSRSGRHVAFMSPPPSRLFSTTPRRLTDGVFRGLTDNRLPMPWIEAFRLQQEGQSVAFAEAHHQVRDLTPRKMSDSYHRVVLPLGRDPWLSDTYINSSGHIRVSSRSQTSLGAVFMDLDALSGVIVYKHTGPGVTTVTAAVDRIELAHPLTEICDLEYSGMVTYAAGGSSAEITCKVARARPAGEPSRPADLLLTCTFTMVALDPATRKPTTLPRLVCSTPEEEALFAAGAAKSRAKKQERASSLLEVEPDDAESALIHKIWLRQLEYHDPNRPLRQPPNVVAMARTQLSTAAIMQPQYRNRHQTMIFGGYHLKQTFELAFCCAASFAHARPTFVSADPCTFRSPVPVGSVLYLTATVAYTDPPVLEVGSNGDGNGNVDGDGAGSTTTTVAPGHADPDHPVTRVHVRVGSKVREMEHGTAKVTGQFNYTFTVPKDVKVLPHTYDEYMKYIDARRRVRAGAGSQPPVSKDKPEEVNLTE
ncbi:acyl-thioesterase [Niveomyces insectorum RCEF 264]|uniref:Acyl-thioesterase n=1 Tax=Niveomyces insectorum RCEF 264 TaxID=1081102 RepID=A0A167VP85_9HYPO|nr:acyl-thioesterase [Niveomyces insectorum RCEF 264]